MKKKSRNEIEETSDDYEVLPDYFVFENEREKFGYRKEGIYFLRFMRAKQLFEKGLPVLLLYSDKSEKPVKEIEEMFRHDGKYGIEKSAWQEYLETKEGQGFIRACNLATEAASGIVTRIQTDRGEFIEDWFDDIRFGAENAYENYLDDRYEKEWSGVRGEEIEEESDEEYYATVRPHIVGIVSEYAHIIKALFTDTVYAGISYEEILLKICERLARNTDNYLFGSRLHKGDEAYEEEIFEGD